MKKINRNQRFLLFPLLLIPLFGVSAYAQGFKGIVPLKSNCEDVKRILGVTSCTFPQSIYRLKDYTVTIDFISDKPSEESKICWRVPVGKVSSLVVSYNKKFPLSEFEYVLKHLEGPIDDIGTVTYVNKEKGVQVFTINSLVAYVGYLPSEKEYKKFSYPCR